MSGNHRFLIDECVPLILVDVANEQGYEAHHVTRLGLAGTGDHVILNRAVEENLIITTNNRDDFTGLVATTALHPGLIVLHGSESRERRVQQFKAALAVIRPWTDAINKVVEVSEGAETVVYSLPPLD